MRKGLWLTVNLLIEKYSRFLKYFLLFSLFKLASNVRALGKNETKQVFVLKVLYRESSFPANRGLSRPERPLLAGKNPPF